MTVFDAHCDTIWKCQREAAALLRHNPHGHWDLPRAKQFTHCAQFFALFVDAKGHSQQDLDGIFAAQYRIFCRELADNAGDISFCHTWPEARAAFTEGKVAAFLSVEGAELLGCSTEGLGRARQMGVRAVNLTWNRANVLSGSVAEDKDRGLSDLGRRFVREMETLGMLVDVSHLSDPGFWDVLEMAQKPILASHSNARALWNHPRNLTDAQFGALIQNGGVAGLNAYAGFLGNHPNLDHLRAQAEHVWALGGEDHLALGGDWDGCDTLPRGMEDGFSSLSRFYEHLLRKNYGESLLNKLFYQNLAKVVEQVCTM